MRSLAAASILAALAASTAAAQVNVTVDASAAVRTVDGRVFGLNTAAWDWSFDTPQSLPLLQAANIGALRFPGGGTADQYLWSSNSVLNSDGSGPASPLGTDFDSFAGVATALKSQVFITVNYGTSTAQDAAAWVAYSKSKGYGFRYWEVGNENYGTWEADINAPPNDPTEYGTRFAQYYKAMKAADPSIKVGAVAATSTEGPYNFPSEAVADPATGQQESGWVPVMLAAIKKAGVMPDFLICHRYEQNSGQEGDATLLQLASTPASGWQVDAALLRGPLNDFYGPAAANVELCVTENNSVHNNPGKQTVSLVNGLYLADSMGSLLQTEFNSLLWWAFRNGPNTGGDNGSFLYGWREFGDYGVVATNPSPPPVGYPAINTPFPAYYVLKLLTHLAKGGDTVVKAASNNTLVSAYAVSRADGSLSILVVNKSPTVTQTVDFAITGYSPEPSATVYSYGIPQDAAAQSGNGSPDVATSSISNAGATFSASFGPYSASVVSLATQAAAPAATSQPASQTVASGSTVVFSFSAGGAPPPSYQWFFNGTALAGATDRTLVISGANPANVGSYTCTATNPSGSVTSSAATLGVVSTSDPGRLVNISCRATVGTGANILIAGFAVGGAGTTGREQLLVRGSGPALVQFSVLGTLPDPQLQLYSGQTPLGTNDGWAGNAQVAGTAAAVGAFPWSSATSHDAALLETLSYGPYTAQIAGQGGDTGVALAEVYDATPAGTYTLTSPRIVNISARVQVGTGGSILIAGFVVGGSTSKTVLIRASGPALNQFGVSGTLADPKLGLYSATGGLLAGDTGWGGDAQVAATAASVGAFSWGSSGTPDSALLVTLAPGAYTAQVSGASGDTGVALVEVYDVEPVIVVEASGRAIARMAR